MYRLTVRLPDEVYRSLEERAREERREVAGLARILIEDGLGASVHEVHESHDEAVAAGRARLAPPAEPPVEVRRTPVIRQSPSLGRREVEPRFKS